MREQIQDYNFDPANKTITLFIDRQITIDELLNVRNATTNQFI